MNSQFWKGKKVLITGHTGFKGGWLSLWLQYLGADIVGCALPPYTEPNLFSAANVAKGMESLYQDINDLNAVNKIIDQYRPEIIIHLAAQPIVRTAHNNPFNTFQTNIMGTVSILEGIRTSKSVKAALVITSDKVYSNKEWAWPYRENDTLGGEEPYSCSKACTELIVSSYLSSYFKKDNITIGIATARAGNVIGGGDWGQDRLVPDIIRALERKHSPLIRSPKSVRPWQYVLDVLAGYLNLIENLYNNPIKYSQAWNFGPNEYHPYSVEDIALRILKLWDNNLNLNFMQDNDNINESKYLTVDCSKSRTILGWKPKLRMDDFLFKTINWHKSFLNKKDLYDLCLNEISEYINKESI